MYIHNKTKVKDLPKGKYILQCDNYESKDKYFLLDGKLALFEVFNTAYAFAYHRRKISQLKGLYKVVEIKQADYKLFNIV